MKKPQGSFFFVFEDAVYEGEYWKSNDNLILVYKLSVYSLTKLHFHLHL